MAALMTAVFLQVSTTQAKLQYLRILNELPTFAGVLFNTVGLVGWAPSGREGGREQHQGHRQAHNHGTLHSPV